MFGSYFQSDIASGRYKQILRIKEERQRAGLRTKPSSETGWSEHSWLRPAADGVAHSTNGSYQLALERVIHLVAQVAHVHVDNVGDSIKTLIPHMLDDHGARKHAPRIRHQVLQQGILFGSKFDPFSA